MIVSKIKYIPKFFDLVVKMQLREQMLVNGYYIVEDIVSIEKIDALMETIFKIFLKYCPSNKFQDYQKPWETDLFHDEMINFRKLEPKKFSLLQLEVNINKIKIIKVFFIIYLFGTHIL